MPQPLRTWTLMNLGTTAVDFRPVLAIHIARVATMWSHVEMQLGLTLAAISGASAELGLAMYLSLAGATPRNAVLRGAAEGSLTEADLKKFDKLIKRVALNQKKRNKVVHAMWGTVDEHPDALIRSDPNEHIIEQTPPRIIGPPATIRETILRGSRQSAKFEIWKERDFFDIERPVAELNDDLRKFTREVRRKYPQ